MNGLTADLGGDLQPSGERLRAFPGPDGRERALRAGAALVAGLDRSGRNDWARTFCDQRGISYTRTQTGIDDTLGGHLIPPELEASIIALRLEYGVFRRNARTVVMNSDRKTIARRTGGLAAYPVAAGASAPKSSLTWDAVELVARKWMVLTKFEDDLSEDSVIDLASYISEEAAYSFSFTEDEVGFNGTGDSASHGIVGVIPKMLGLSGTIANIAGLVVASGNAWSDITDGDLHKLVGRLPQFARQPGRVKWYCHTRFWSEVILNICFAKGGVSYAEAANGPEPRLYGYPVELVEVMPGSQADSQVCLLFGNLAQAAAFGDRRGIRVAMSDSNESDFEVDVRSLKATQRFDINVHDVGNESATAALRKPGPIVGLITAAS